MDKEEMIRQLKVLLEIYSTEFSILENFYDDVKYIVEKDEFGEVDG